MREEWEWRSFLKFVYLYIFILCVVVILYQAA